MHVFLYIHSRLDLAWHGILPVAKEAEVKKIQSSENCSKPRCVTFGAEILSQFKIFEEFPICACMKVQWY